MGSCRERKFEATYDPFHGVSIPIYYLGQNIAQERGWKSNKVIWFKTHTKIIFNILIHNKNYILPINENVLIIVTIFQSTLSKIN